MKTVKDLIAALLEYPMNAKVAVEVNDDKEYDIQEIYSYTFGIEVLLKIETGGR